MMTYSTLNGCKPLAIALTTLVVLLGPCHLPAQQTIDAVTAVGEQRIAEGVSAQREVERISDRTTTLESEYRQITKVVEGLTVYNGLLQKQVDNQLDEVAALSDSINKVALIERQIVPLMMQMIATLDEFVGLDVPFLPQERAKRVVGLQTMMERSDVTAAEKFRRIIEAYQIENEYGRTIEAYKGSLKLDGGNREVNFLRLGRVALLYQTDGGELTGAWDQAAGSWHELAPEVYKHDVAKGLRVARKQVAPDLLVLPIRAPTEASQ